MEYSTINGYRCAISAFHIPIEGMKAGSHPRVTELLKGVSNERPPNPGIHYTWDVDKVLMFMKSLPENGNLSRKMLTLKTVTLLGICNINRCMELAALNTKLMSKRPDHYQFGFGITTKHSRKGKPVPPVYFHSFPKDTKICPVQAIDDYSLITNDDRVAQNTFGLFLGIPKPHRPVESSTIGRWVVNFLSLAGIDTRHFSGHSVRGASSSKAKSKGTKLKTILRQGNWSSENFWQKHYHKNVGSSKSPTKGASVSSSREFQRAILEDVPEC